MCTLIKSYPESIDKIPGSHHPITEEAAISLASFPALAQRCLSQAQQYRRMLANAAKPSEEREALGSVCVLLGAGNQSFLAASAQRPGRRHHYTIMCVRYLLIPY